MVYYYYHSRVMGKFGWKLLLKSPKEYQVLQSIFILF